MHVPDGFLDAPTSAATAILAAGAVGVALKRSRAELDERTAPLAGLVAAFVFAVQMLNFPVGIGTSGHLMGGVLAAVLVGPWTGLLCVTVVLVVQALLFADGGLTALGTNVLLIAVVTVAAGWLVTRAAQAALPERPASVVPAAFLGALLSVPAAALVFVALYEVGGAVDIGLGALLASMLGWHVLVGIGEALITAATVGAVLAVRPDLVFAARGLTADLELRTAYGAVRVPSAGDRRAGQARRGAGPLVAVGGAVTLVLAGVVSFFASPNPDGLERVAEDRGFLAAAGDHAFGSFGLADYGDVGGIPVGLAGLLGVAVTVAVGLAVFVVMGRRSGSPRPRERQDA